MMRIILAITLTLFLADPSFAGTSTYFDGTNDEIDWGSPPNIVTQTSLSMACWVNVESNASDAAAISTGDSAGLNDGLTLWRDDVSSSSSRTDIFSFHLDDGPNTTRCESPSSTATAGIWFWLAGTFTANSATGAHFYINGTEIADSPCDTTNISDSGGDGLATGLFMGESEGSGFDYEGNIAYCQVWNRVLTLAELEQARWFPGSVANGLQLYAPLLGVASPEVDWSGNGLTGTITGAATSTTLGPPVMIGQMLSMWHRFWNQLTNWWMPEAWASDVVIFDPAHPIVPNKVSGYLKSVNTPDYQSNPNALINPNLSGVAGVSQSDWKVDAGTVVEMSQAEKDAIIADANAQAEASLRSGTKAQFDGNSETPLALRCLASVILDEINTLRTRTNAIEGCISNASNLAQAKSCTDGLVDFSDRTLSQAKSAIASCVDNKTADE